MALARQGITLGTTVSTPTATAATTTAATATLTCRCILLTRSRGAIGRLDWRRGCRCRRLGATLFARFAARLARFAAVTTTAASPFAALWTRHTLGTLDAFGLGRTLFGDHFRTGRLGFALSALAIIAASAASTFGAASVRAFAFVALLDLLGLLAARPCRTLIAATTTRTTATALLATSAAAASFWNACFLRLTDSAAGATRDAHAEWPRTEAKEPALAFLDGRDRGLRALQPEIVEPLANSLILRLAFVDRTFCHGVPCLPDSRRVTKRNDIALGRSLGRIV